MEPITPAVSRRGLLAATVTAGTALALTVPARASAQTPTGSTELVEHDRIGTMATKSPTGQTVTLTYAADFHDRLGDWVRLWWANAPSMWLAPFELITPGTAQGGYALRLAGISYTRAGRTQLGFDATARDTRYWATVASLYRHFPRVTTHGGYVEISDGQAGFTGSSEQAAFIQVSLAQVWGQATAPSDITSRRGWYAFTTATARRGLSVHHNR